MTEGGAAARQPRHPGSSRRKGRTVPKGRQVQPAALEEVRVLLGSAERRRDLLIEFLHLIQDKYGHLSAAHLMALAEEMRLAQAEVYEVATFYAHFDVVREGASPPPPLTIRVCDSLSCALAGADRLLTTLQNDLGPGIRVVRAPCVGHCHTPPVAEVGHHFVDHADAGKVASAAREHQHHPEIPAYTDLVAYRAAGGYRSLETLRSGELSRERLVEIVDQAGLRGCGGAGFPTARKWRSVLGEPGPRLMAVNADEGEPGTFKDRYFLESDPHRVLEGMLMGAHLVEAHDIYFYLRDEYPECREILTREIAALEAAGLLDGVRVHLRRGAGAYICGEESAMIESIEGKRGLPRHRPPLPFQVGIFGRPTLINNVETLYWIRDLIERGPDWWQGQGRNGRKGLHTYSVSGRIVDPGVKIAPAGVTVRELIDEFCGGMLPGHTLKAYVPGGPSSGILPATLGDVPLDFGTLEAHGSFIGSAAVVILSDHDDIKQAAINLMRFFEDESCGQCTPCRAGTEKAVKLMAARGWDETLLAELAVAMRDASICGLGQAAPNTLTTVMKHFPTDVGIVR
ncbi:MAG: NAD(P)H-dependent oxidoreductase subunit E [Alphaproteobacteria bacterium]|nr:NAD(P)H-dependent oxidoreductase subunit E [Alphaproteobacteria bacterium]